MQHTDSHEKQKKNVSYNVTLAYLHPGEKLHNYFDMSPFKISIHGKRTHLSKLSLFAVELFFTTELIMVFYEFRRLNLIHTYNDIIIARM